MLYTIARTIFELDLSVSLAKIGTYLDQVVDVFYVTDATGRKIDSEARLENIHARLLKAIEDEAAVLNSGESELSRSGEIRS